MKRPSSKLIATFLSDVRKGVITGTEDSTKPSTLQVMVSALKNILDGANPEAALGITRKKGPTADGYNEVLAIKIHNLRQQDYPWSAIEEFFKKEHAQRGRIVVSESRLKQIYKDHFPAEQYERVMREMYQAANIQLKRQRALAQEIKQETSQKKSS